MKFLGFSKIWRRFLENNFFKKKKKIFEMKYILRISSPDFGKPQKFHLSVFVSTGFGRNDFHLLPRLELFFPQERKVISFQKKSVFLSD